MPSSASATRKLLPQRAMATTCALMCTLTGWMLSEGEGLCRGKRKLLGRNEGLWGEKLTVTLSLQHLVASACLLAWKVGPMRMQQVPSRRKEGWW